MMFTERTFCFVMMCISGCAYLTMMVAFGQAIRGHKWADAFASAVVGGFFLFALWAYRKRDEAVRDGKG